MTVRITVSLPDSLHADLTRVAASSHISASAVVRAILSDLLPRLTTVLDHLGNLSPEEARGEVEKVDAWAASLRRLMHDAPEPLAGFRPLLDDGPPEVAG